MSGTISREELQAKLNRQDKFQLVETLPEDQFRQGHLPGAVNLPPDQIKERASNILPDCNAEIVVYCGSSKCTASENAAKELEGQGYTRIRRYVGGKQDWIDAGQSLEGAPQQAVAMARDTVATSPTHVAR
jgi:rhodanese-related sulfurtransferase